MCHVYGRKHEDNPTAGHHAQGYGKVLQQRLTVTIFLLIATPLSPIRALERASIYHQGPPFFPCTPSICRSNNCLSPCYDVLYSTKKAPRAAKIPLLSSVKQDLTLSSYADSHFANLSHFNSGCARGGYRVCGEGELRARLVRLVCVG